MSDSLDLSQRASFGGPGLVLRVASHAQDVAAGCLWRACGYRSEVGPLREVMLAWPGNELDVTGAPDDWLMLEKPDLGRIQEQCLGLVAAYEAVGVQVHVVHPDAAPPPNWIFMRDLFLATEEGILLGRTAARVRAGEERHAAAALAALGFPILGMPRGEATFEGADALWISPDQLLVGVGARTNAQGLAFLTNAMTMMGVQVLPFLMPKGVQHLLGIVNFIDRDLAAVDGGRAGPELLTLLEERGIRCIVMKRCAEMVQGRAMNFVNLGPRRILMPSRCPVSRGRFEAEGAEVFEADVSEYLKAAGGIGCLTGILRRG